MRFKMHDDSDLVRLRWPDGSVSDWMPFDRAAFIRAFSFNNQPEIVEEDDNMTAAPQEKI